MLGHWFTALFSRRAFGFGALALLLGLAVLPGQAKAAIDSPTALIQDLGNRTIEILQNPKNGLPERKAAFSKIFVEGFDVNYIGKFVLGRYWRDATPQQQHDYLDYFGKYVVAIYANRFSAYSGQKFTVEGARDQDGISIVSTVIIPAEGGAPIHTDWKIIKTDQGFKIVDVIVENLSMTVTQRADFASIIDQHGGNVQALIDILKQKVDSN